MRNRQTSSPRAWTWLLPARRITSGQVTFAQGSTGDTLTLPTTGSTWSSLGFAAGDPIVVSGAIASADDGAFTIASVSGYTLTLTQVTSLPRRRKPVSRWEMA